MPKRTAHPLERKIELAAPKNKIEPADIQVKVKTAVHDLLGKPNDHDRTEIHLYQGRRARANIWRKQRIKKKGLLASDFVDQTTITDSFYLVLNPKGEIVQASPPIQKRY